MSRKININRAKLLLSKSLLYSFLLVSLMAMDPANPPGPDPYVQTYNVLTADYNNIDQDTNILLGDYNHELLNSFQSMYDGAYQAYRWARHHNRLAQVNVNKSNLISDRIASIAGRIATFSANAQARAQAGQAIHGDQNILNSLNQANNIRQQAQDAVNRARVAANRSQTAMHMKKQLSFGLSGLLVFIWVVLRDVRQTKSWHDFFVAPAPKPCKLLEKAEPLSITKETNQRIKGVGRLQSEQVRCSLFEDMAKNINQEVSKVDTEPAIIEPVQSPKQVTFKPKKVIQKVNKAVTAVEQEKNYFPVSYERKGRKRNIKVKNSFAAGYGNSRDGGKIDFFNFLSIRLILSIIDKTLHLSIKNRFCLEEGGIENRNKKAKSVL